MVPSNQFSLKEMIELALRCLPRNASCNQVRTPSNRADSVRKQSRNTRKHGTLVLCRAEWEIGLSTASAPCVDANFSFASNQNYDPLLKHIVRLLLVSKGIIRNQPSILVRG